MRLVLAGAGHAHAEVLRQFARDGVHELELVLVSPLGQAPYSGMVPGWLAGHYRWDECCIDFQLLCVRAGARRLAESIAALDAERQQILLTSGARLAYDWLSLNVGATLHPPPADHPSVLPLRPLAALRERWDSLLQEIGHGTRSKPYRIVMVGGGVAGVESILAAHARLTQLAPHTAFAFTLATQGDAILAELATGAARRLEAAMAARGIAIVHGFSAERIAEGWVIATNGHALHAETVLWATGAQAHQWLCGSGLATNARGFVQVDASLRSTSHPNVFAAGDCAGWKTPLPKSGVYAVRMGPVLAQNLDAAIFGKTLQHYRPQRCRLVLVGTGGTDAVAAWGPLSAQGAWVWRGKQRIDRHFLSRYNRS